MKQLRSTLILLLVVGALGGYIYFNERGPALEEGAVSVLRTGPEGPQTIRLTAGGNVTQLQRNGENWQVAKVTGGKTGTFVPADSVTANSLADALKLVQSKNVLDNPGEPKLYGLDKPAAVVEADGQKLELGTKPQADQSQVYARSNGKVALVPATLLENATRAFNDWRDKNVLQVKTDEVTSFSVQAPQVKAQFSKADSNWKITSPVDVAADSASVESFLSTLSTTQSTAWLDDKGTDLARWGLDKPQAVVTVGDKSLKIGKKLSGGYAGQNSLSATVFQVPDTLWAQLNRPLKDWRDKRVAAFVASDVTSVELTSGGTAKTFVKADEKWQESGGKADDKVHNAVQDLLFAISSWTAQDFVQKPAADSAYGLDKPRLRAAIQADKAYSLTLGEKSGKAYVRTGDGTLMQLSPDIWSTTDRALQTLFPAKK